MGWFQGSTPSVVHDKPLSHGGTRMGLLAQREGYGAGTIGGLYANEVVVTNLNDSGAGSLRAALSGGPAWITFQKGLTAPARSTWLAPQNNAPSGAYNATAIHQQSNLAIASRDVTIDGRGTQYGVEGFGITANHLNVIIENFRIDFSQWWAGGPELQNSHAGALYNINDPDATYSHGVQPIQKTEYQKIYRGAYSTTLTYSTNDVVTYNGVGYRSLVGSNTNHQPDTSPTQWTPAVPSTTGGAVAGNDYGFWMGTWSATTTYQLGAGVYYQGLVYTSTIDSNLNHAPGGSQWKSFDPTNSPWSASTTYAKGDSVIGGSGTSATLYISLVNSNLNSAPPSANWVAIGNTGSVNGEIYCGTSANLNPPTGTDTGLEEMGLWCDHNTLIGVPFGAGSPAKGDAFWDFNDGGFALCYQNHHATYSWNHFQDVNKSSIIGCNSTDVVYAGDWVTLSHNWFQRGFQRQPLTRFSHTHIIANYYDQDYSVVHPAGPPASQMIAGEKSTQALYEGNLGYASVALQNALAIARDGSPTQVVGKTGHGNSVDQDGSLMTLANDQGTIGFTPPYTIALPDLSTSGARTAFKTLMQSAGQQ